MCYIITIRKSWKLGGYKLTEYQLALQIFKIHMSATNTGLVSIPFSSTAHWRSGRDCHIIQMGGNREKYLDNFSWGEVPNSVITYFICLEYNTFGLRINCFLTLLKDLNVSERVALSIT